VEREHSHTFKTISARVESFSHPPAETSIDQDSRSINNMDRPGIGLPLEQASGLPFEGRTGCWYEVALPVTVRERVIIVVTATLKDKPDWERKVFDETIMNKWRLEALTGNHILQGQSQTVIAEDGHEDVQPTEPENPAPDVQTPARQRVVTEKLFQDGRLSNS
jgi:hypothetical protein